MKVPTMMLSKKTLTLMLIGLFTNSMHAVNSRYSQVHDIHSIIQVIKEVEGEIKLQKQKEADLYDRCFSRKQVKDGSVTEMVDGKAVKKNTYKYEKTRRVDCTDEMVNEYHQSRDNKRKCIEACREKVRNAVKASKDSLATKDFNGCTVSKYCYTSEIYDELRANGAPFELFPWMYFNSNEIIVVSTASALLGAVVYEYVTKK